MKIALERVESPFVFQLTNESGSRIFADASETIGGKNKGFRPMELVASGLASCVAIDVLEILRKQRSSTEIFGIDIEAERVEGTPSPFASICLNFHVDATIDTVKLATYIQLVIDKYCSVAASLKDTIQITYKINGKDE